MKSVLISIKPKWCELIASGKKTIEVRKNSPKIETPFKCYIYCTKAKTIGDIILCKSEENAKLFGHNAVIGINKGFSEKEDINLKGKVISEFVCDKIYDIEPHYDTPNFCNQYECGWNAGDADDCISFTDFNTYLGGKHGYGWHISDLKIYDKPKELSEFYKSCPDKYHYCEICKHGSIMLPPDEEEYAMYHGGNYENYETICHNRVTRPPQSWMFVEELQDV